VRQIEASGRSSVVES